jgi:hypothetical protein
LPSARVYALIFFSPYSNAICFVIAITPDLAML